MCLAPMKNEDPVLQIFTAAPREKGLWLRMNRVGEAAKHDALIGHGGAQVGDETPLGLSLGSAEKCWLVASGLFICKT